MQNTDGFHNIAFDYILFAFCSFNLTSASSSSTDFFSVHFSFSILFFFSTIITITKQQNNSLVFVRSWCYFLFEAIWCMCDIWNNICIYLKSGTGRTIEMLLDLKNSKFSCFIPCFVCLALFFKKTTSIHLFAKSFALKAKCPHFLSIFSLSLSLYIWCDMAFISFNTCTHYRIDNVTDIFIDTSTLNMNRCCWLFSASNRFWHVHSFIFLISFRLYMH